MRRSEILPLPTASWIGWCIPLTGSSCKENRCVKNEEARMERNEKAEESCGNGGAMESVESQKQASPSFHSPLEISPKAGEIPTFPQLRRLRRGKVENQKQVSHFPTAFSYMKGKTALSENLTEWAYYVAFMIRRTARSSRLLADSRLALSS